MAKVTFSVGQHEATHKRTSIGGKKPKLSSMNKDQKRSYKRYRGQGK